jgi:hypothetical protein
VSDLHAEKVQQAVVLVDLTSRSSLCSKIAECLQELCTNTTLACWFLLGVAAGEQHTSVYKHYECEVRKVSD